jgi:hypothetical protein
VKFKSSSTIDSNIAPTCGSIDQLTCPSNNALVISAARRRPFAKSNCQFNSTSADEGKQCAASHRYKLPNARREPRKGSGLDAGGRVGQGAALTAGPALEDFGVGSQ